MNLARKLWQRRGDLVPLSGFHFDRPLVLFQSDDWGRVGLRDREGLEQLRSAGIALGEHPYDLYTLETAEDLAALSAVLRAHNDAHGRNPCMEMNFVTANLDFTKMAAGDFGQIHLLPLSEGLPAGWSRPGLVSAYGAGIADGVFYPALHGTTHFCRPAVERNLAGDEHRASLLRAMWQAGTPYIYPRMPWIGFEYWDAEMPESERFLTAQAQQELIGQTIGLFVKLFCTLPRSAVAPGHRANSDTHRAWAQHGIRVAQNGSAERVPPYFDGHHMLNLSRTVDFEPAVDTRYSLEACLRDAETSFARGIPAIVSVHSINFHSTVGNFRERTLQCLDEFLTALESKHPDLLYLQDADLYEVVTQGSYRAPHGVERVNVTKTAFFKPLAARQWHQ